MNKSELIDRIAEKAETTKTAAARVLDALFDASSGAIAEAVQTGKDVKIPGFGKFASRKRAARKGRNPRTGAEIDIPENTVITFSAGKALKDTLSDKPGTARKKPARGAGTKKSGSAATKRGGSSSAAKSVTGAKKTGTAGGSTKGAGRAGGGGAKASPTKR